VVCGLLAGCLSAIVTQGVYTAEDLFQKLPLHWKWWPAIGGVFVGLGGLIFPQALGVGYDTIGSMLQGDVPRAVLAGVLLVKSAIWVISLGSGTSGGVLAPLLMMGAALGGVEAAFLPAGGTGFWPLVSMGAMLAGTMGAPFTAILFALELTHDVHVLLPLLIAATLAHFTTVLLMHRSILTEKLARRGFHLTREYSIDPLEILFVREVMRTQIVALPAEATIDDLRDVQVREPAQRGQHLYPIIDSDRHVKGVVTRKQLRALTSLPDGNGSLGDKVQKPVVASPDEPLRAVVFRMAETGFTRMPVVDDGRLVGMVSLYDLLTARARNLHEERAREQVLRLRLPFAHRR
jgi:CBS domain-containing protein